MSTSAEHNVALWLEHASRRSGERTALASVDETVTFRELASRVERVAAGLRAIGLARGERVIVMVPMSIDLYVGLLAILRAGAVAVFVDPWVGRRQIAAFSAFAEPAAWMGIGKSHVVRWMEPSLRRIERTITTGWRLGPWPARHRLRDLARSRGMGAVEPVSLDDPALITFTTGSSGVPKGANRTHGFLIAQHEALKAEFAARDDDVDMAHFPVFALNNLASGIPTVIPDMDFRRVAEVDAARIAAQMAQHGVSTCTASPPFFDRLAEHSARLPALRRILTGGAPVADRQLERWRAAFPKTEIVVVYGSTEAEPVGHIDAGERLAIARARGKNGYLVGRLSERVSAKVIRIDGGAVALDGRGWSAWEMPRGEVGELVVSGAHVCRDYFKNPEAALQNKIVEPGGRVWHRMGDTGRFDDAGRFWLVGRVHSTIRRAGVLVHPQLVEQAALEGDARIRRVAAVGAPDAALGERVVVFVEIADAEVGEADVRRRLIEAGQPCDELRVSTRALPVDPRHNAKIDYAALRRTLGAGAHAARSPS